MWETKSATGALPIADVGGRFGSFENFAGASPPCLEEQAGKGVPVCCGTVCGGRSVISMIAARAPDLQKKHSHDARLYSLR